MSEALNELQRRLTAAMDEIAAGLDELEKPAPVPDPAPEPEAPEADPEEISRLNQALEDERTVNAQLQERVRTIKQRQSDRMEELEKAEAEHRVMLEKLDSAVVRLRKVNTNLRDSLRTLREANAEGVADPHLINQAMLAELEGLRADHEASQIEADAILSELEALAGRGSSEPAEEAP